MRPTAAGLIAGIALALTATAEGAGPADSLLRLVPPDAGLTLAVEDLAGHAREFFASPLADGLGRLPAVRAWLGSDRSRGLRQARRHIEQLLGESVATVRDALLGEAVVLTLRLPPNGRPDQARGMLLVRVGDRALLDRLVRAVNDEQLGKGELLRVVEHTRGGVRYWVREFPPASRRPAEAYTVVADRTFAWSNAEDLVLGVIDRGAGGPPGLGDDPAFRRVRDRLPEHPAVSLFANPRFLEAVMAAGPRPSKPEDERVEALLGRYVHALAYAGAAIEWRRGGGSGGPALVLHTEESFNPDDLPDWLRRWASRLSAPTRRVRVPASALAAASVHLDFESLLDVARELTPEADRRKLDNLIVALSGVLLGRDLRAAILPRLGPAVLAHLDAPPSGDGAEVGPSLVTLVDLAGDAAGGEVAAPLDNALRTFLALYALDAKHGGGQLHIEETTAASAKVTSLAPSSPFAYALAPGRLALGRSAGAVARALDPDRASSDRFDRVRAESFPESESFAWADLEALHRFADLHRAAIARRIAARHGAPIEGSRRDLDHALALIGLFRDAYLTSELAPDARRAHRRLGLIARGAGEVPASP